jgi:hypothetical protein
LFAVGTPNLIAHSPAAFASTGVTLFGESPFAKGLSLSFPVSLFSPSSLVFLHTFTIGTPDLVAHSPTALASTGVALLGESPFAMGARLVVVLPDFFTLFLP